MLTTTTGVAAGVAGMVPGVTGIVAGVTGVVAGVAGVDDGALRIALTRITSFRSLWIGPSTLLGFGKSKLRALERRFRRFAGCWVVTRCGMIAGLTTRAATGSRGATATGRAAAGT